MSDEETDGSKDIAIPVEIEAARRGTSDIIPPDYPEHNIFQLRQKAESFLKRVEELLGNLAWRRRFLEPNAQSLKFAVEELKVALKSEEREELAAALMAVEIASSKIEGDGCA